MTVPQCIITASSVDALIGDSADVGDIIDASELEGMNFTFVCNVKSGTFLPTSDGGLHLVMPVPARVDSGGVLCRVDPLTNIIGAPGVPLLADDPSLGLTTPLQWHVLPDRTFDVLGVTVRPKRWWFDAPADGVTVSLASLTPVNGASAEGVKGNPGEPIDTIRRVANTIVATVAGVDVPSPVDISDLLFEPGVRIIYVDSFTGSDPTGATFSDTAVAAARTALGTSSGVIVFGAGYYKLASSIAAFGPQQGALGYGRGSTVIRFSGSGDCFRVRDTRAFVDSPHYLPGSTGGAGFGGQIGPLSIDGTGAGASACGLHIGDIVHMGVDVSVFNFTGATAKGVWLDNQLTWIERSTFKLGVENCTKGILFDVNGGFPSFMYNDFDFWTNSYANQKTVVLQGACVIQGGRLKWNGACFAGTAAALSGATANTGVALSVGEDATACAIRSTELLVDLECQGYNVANASHKTIVVGSTSQIHNGCHGHLSFSNGGFAWAAGDHANRLWFNGPILCDGDATLGGMDPEQAGRAIGLMSGSAGYFDPAGDIYLGQGNWFLAQMTAGAHTVTPHFDSSMYYTNAAEFDVFVKQPASGATTLTWPGAWVWLDGGPPVLSTVNNGIDWIHVSTTEFGTFFAKHMNASIAPGVHAATSKATPVDADELALVDSASTPANGPKKLTWANLKAALKTYFDSVTTTLTNKTLTDPKINAIKDSSGANQLTFFAPASAVNYLRANSAAAGAGPAFEVLGSDTNIGLGLHPKGGSGLNSYVNTQTALDFYVFGDLTDVHFNTKPQGAGRLQENGNTAATWVAVPSTATSTGKVGQMAADSSFLYICTATNVWRRVAIASW